MKHVHRPCDECPWRRDAAPGRFARNRWQGLAPTSVDDRGFGPGVTAPLFACHKTPEGAERACAGWLAVEGHAHPLVRLAIVTGKLNATVLEPQPDWPALHGSFSEAAGHDLGDGQPQGDADPPPAPA